MRRKVVSGIIIILMLLLTGMLTLALENNRDLYPLMKPWKAPDIRVVNVSFPKTVIWQGFSLPVNVTVHNSGDKVEAFSLSIYACAFQDRLKMAVTYLENQFNPNLNLCREAPLVAPNTYWLVSDNLWAYYALEPYNLTLSSRIKEALIKYAKKHGIPTDAQGLPLSYAHEAVLPGRRVPTPFRTWNPLTLETNNYTIRTVIANGTLMLDWQEYADLLLYASLSSYWSENLTAATEYFSKAVAMWDGMGIYDIATRVHGLYETYKLGLLLYASKVLNYKLPFEHQLIERVWRQQATNGGIITHYKPDGEPIGDTNTETTAIVVIASPVIKAEIERREIMLNYNQTTTITFAWDTTGFAKGNYTISAYAWPVLGETNTADNSLINSWVIVAMIGDITGPNGWPDGKVDMKDVDSVARLFGTYKGHLNYNPNCDINCDGVIDIYDIAWIARNFSKDYTRS